MGYMGFGMQKRVYTMQPRRPFKMDRKGLFSTIPKYRLEFKEKPSASKGSYNFGILIFLIFSILLIIAIPNFNNYKTSHNQIVKSYEEQKKTKAFNFLMHSGTYRLKSGNIFGAYSEFKLAKAIYPNDETVNALLLESLSILCFDEGKHCEDLDAFY